MQRIGAGNPTSGKAGSRNAAGVQEVEMGLARVRALPGALAALLLWGAGAPGAQAHPHIWILFETTVLHDGKGTFVGVRHKWTFDEFYTAMAIDGLDKNKDGVWDRGELAELAKVNIDGLKDFSYFTIPALAGKALKVGEASDYYLEHKDGALSLHFTLRFETPVLAEAKGLTISVYDPTYFIAFEPAKADPVKLAEGAPKGCEARIGAPPAQAKEEAQGLESLQAQLGALGVNIAKTITVDCSGP
jgi:ABC-type uncharacterized transport system substrate-binding protein